MGTSLQYFIRALLLFITVISFEKALALSHYQSEITNSEWLLSGDIFSCSLTHPVSNYGEGRFIKKAGEPMKFVLQRGPNNWHRTTGSAPLQ